METIQKQIEEQISGLTGRVRKLDSASIMDAIRSAVAEGLSRGLDRVIIAGARVGGSVPNAYFRKGRPSADVFYFSVIIDRDGIVNYAIYTRRASISPSTSPLTVARWAGAPKCVLVAMDDRYSTESAEKALKNEGFDALIRW